MKPAKADDPRELEMKAVECLEIYRTYMGRILVGNAHLSDLAIAKALRRAGVAVKPGQAITYVITGSHGATQTKNISNCSEGPVGPC